MKLKITDKVKRTRTIEGQTFDVINGYANIADLHFWDENPRIYSLLDDERLENVINKDLIYSKMILHHDFDSLKTDIREDGQINDAIWVSLNAKTKNYTVYEGNTRLAVAIQLSENDTKKDRQKWTKIHVNVLPDNTSEKIIKRLIGLIHLKGVNQWEPFEADGYYYRETMDAKADGLSLKEAFAKVSKNYGVAANKVKTAHKMISFMEKYQMSPRVRKNHYSYWNIVTTQADLQKVRSVFNNVNFLRGKIDKPSPDAFDKMLIEKIKKGEEIQRATASSSSGGTAFRDDIKLISEAFNENKDVSLITELIKGEITIETAVDRAREGGAGDAEFEKVKKFAEWLCHTETMRKLQNAVIKYPDLENEVKTIQDRSATATLKLKRKEKKTMNPLDSNNQEHLSYKLCILMMLADRFPHPKELEKISKIIESKNWTNSIDSDDMLDAIDQVSREIYQYKGVRKAGSIYAQLLDGKEIQKSTFSYCEEIMLADGEEKIEETRLLVILKDIWNI